MKCHIRKATSADHSRLEEIYLGHEGISLPAGYFDEFRETLRDDDVTFLVAEAADEVVGGGGVLEDPGGISLVFGVVAPESCRRGYGTDLLLARLSLVPAPPEGIHVSVNVTEWSADFFRRLGFTWHGSEEDPEGNLFLWGHHILYPSMQERFRKYLHEREVILADDIIAG